MSSTCALHDTATAPHPVPVRGRVCVSCTRATGTDAYRRTHFCRCCGCRFDRCLPAEGRAFCKCCGLFDDATDEFVESGAPDPLTDLLTGLRDLDPDHRCAGINAAATLFGNDIAARLVPVEASDGLLDGDTADVVIWRLMVEQTALPMRYRGPDRFNAGSPCTDCGIGTRWTPVTSRKDLLAVHLYGPGPDASACTHPRPATHAGSADPMVSSVDPQPNSGDSGRAPIAVNRSFELLADEPEHPLRAELIVVIAAQTGASVDAVETLLRYRVGVR